MDVGTACQVEVQCDLGPGTATVAVKGLVETLNKLANRGYGKSAEG